MALQRNSPVFDNADDADVDAVADADEAGDKDDCWLATNDDILYCNLLPPIVKLLTLRCSLCAEW